MEKFYIVTPETELYDEYIRYKENIPVVNEIVKTILTKYGIETHLYAAANEYLCIQPTENDKVNFVNQLKTQIDLDLYPFKKNSVIGKEWINTLKENNIKVLHKPLIQFYFKACGKARFRLFHIDDVIYASYETNGEFDNPNGFHEIKASEFYKATEDVE